MANTYLTRTFGSAGNRKKWTFSAWVKKAANGVEQRLLTTSDNSTFDDQIKFKGADKLEIVCNSGSGVLTTNRLFRDNSAWYHIVAIWDSGNATSGDRCQLWVNGIRETSFATETYPSINQDGFINNNTPHYIGVTNAIANSNHFNGIMSHVHFIDGTAYDATAFGEYDANGVWKINTSPSVTYGTNGFFILKDGNSVTDQSPNTNNFTVGGGTLTNTEDSPSNVFATLNPLNPTSSAVTYSNGNTKSSFPASWVASLSNLGVSSGKYYWEAKVNSGNNANLTYGICSEMVPAGNGFYNNSQNGVVVNHIAGDIYRDGSYTASGAETFSNGNIVGVALDLDSATKTVKFYKNGTLLSSGSTVNLSSYYDNTNVFAWFTGNSSSASASWETNFGNGYFGTTAVTTAGINASGIGIFEYDVPTGYTALSTKGLNL